jgi:hypothetical protein
MSYKGTSKRAAIARAMPHHGYQRDRATQACIRLGDGTWIATRLLYQYATANIPMPDCSGSPMVIAIGYRGREWVL